MRLLVLLLLLAAPVSAAARSQAVEASCSSGSIGRFNCSLRVTAEAGQFIAIGVVSGGGTSKSLGQQNLTISDCSGAPQQIGAGLLRNQTHRIKVTMAQRSGAHCIRLELEACRTDGAPDFCRTAFRGLRLAALPGWRPFP